eukprot:scaffold13813_cov50-Attheya_sp.AAC.2
MWNQAGRQHNFVDVNVFFPGSRLHADQWKDPVHESQVDAVPAESVHRFCYNYATQPRNTPINLPTIALLQSHLLAVGSEPYMHLLACNRYPAFES